MSDIKNSSLVTNLVSYWELEEASGTRVDSHGSNDLTDNNTVGQATGIQGNAADFTAANDESLTIADASQSGLDLNSDFSIAGWVRIDTRGKDNGIASKYNSSSGDRAFMCLITAGNDLQLYLTQTGATSPRVLGESTSEFIEAGDVGNWVHFAAVFDLSESTVTLYKNGSPVSVSYNNDGTVTSVQNNTVPFALGDANQTGGDYLDGGLDEIGVWSRMLTSGEVSSLYNSGAGLPYDAAGAAPSLDNALAWCNF